MKFSKMRGAMAGLFGAVCLAGGAEPPLVTLTYRVLDDWGAPVSNASVLGYSNWPNTEDDGFTDSSGCFRFKGSVGKELGCRVSKTGYYDTYGPQWMADASGDLPPAVLTVVLRKIINPVPMTFRRVFVALPKAGVPFAFDLAVGDLTAPHGKGVEKDVWFVGMGSYVSNFDHTERATMTFTKPLDGIQAFYAQYPNGMESASALIPPQVAPIEGYTNRMDFWQTLRPGRKHESSEEKNKKFIFRVRSVTNEAGQIVRANVGWTEGGIIPETGDQESVIGVLFAYYYNANPLSRSLEPALSSD